MAWTVPRVYVTGYTTRDADSAQLATYLGVEDSYVVQFSTGDLFPNNGHDMDPATMATIDAWFAWGANRLGVSGRPMKVLLRPRAGFYAPPWLKVAAGGAMLWYTNNGVGNIPPGDVGGTAPSDSSYSLYKPGTTKWWVTPNADGLDAMSQSMANRWGSHPALGIVDFPYCATQFNEWCNHQGGCQENVDTQMGAGYNEAAEETIFARGLTAARDIWAKPYGVSCRIAWNSLGTYGGTPGHWTFAASSNTARTFRLMELQASILGRFADVGNNSFDQSWTYTGARSFEQQVWDYQAAMMVRNIPVGYQSSTTTQMHNNTPPSTAQGSVDAAITIGAHRFEIPTGSQSSSAGTDYLGGAYLAKSNLLNNNAPSGVQLWRP